MMEYKQTAIHCSALGVIALIILQLAGCGTSSITSLHHDQAGSLQDAIAEVHAADVPAGVDAALFSELTAELTRVIRETAEKGASIPPSGDFNVVTDLTLLGNDTDGWRLQWTYRNVGDYNLDSLVNVSDLTSIGQNFNASAGDENWDRAQLADGNNDGLITVADITPIGQNFLAFVAGYSICGADDPAGPWAEFDTLDLPAPLDASVPFDYALATKDYSYYHVIPIDGENVAGDPSWSSLVTLATPAVTLGADTQWDTASIGDSGGILSGPDIGDGPITVAIPAGALAEALDFEFGTNSGQVTRDGENLGGEIVYLWGSEFVEFAEPALITIPLPDDASIPAGFRITQSGALIPLELLTIDRDLDTATFALDIAFPAVGHTVSHIPVLPEFTPGLWFINNLMQGAMSEVDNGFKTKFLPKEDGFSVGDVYGNQSGSVPIELGMAPFAIWYFRNYRTSHGPLAWFHQNVQSLIGLRALTSVWIGTTIDPWEIRPGLTSQDSFAAIKRALVASNGPVFVLCQQSMFPSHRDFAIAYGYSGDELLIYRPRWPGESERFDALADGHHAVLVSTDRFPMYEPFENILLDATDDPPFGGSSKATISVTSHTSGDIVDNEAVTLTGYTTSGAVLVEELFVYSLARCEEKPKCTSVPVSGDFEVDVLLAPGTNQLLFITRGYFDDFVYRTDPYMMQVPNNLGYEHFGLEYETTSTTGTLAGTIVDSHYGNELDDIDLSIKDKQTLAEVYAESVSKSYAAELPPGWYICEFTSSYYEPLAVGHRMHAGSTINGDAALTLKAGRRIFGHVWEFDGVTFNQPELWKPLGGVEITWTHDSGVSWPGMPLPPQYSTTADGSGAYSLTPVDGFRMDGSWRFSAVKEGYHESHLYKCSLPAPELDPLSWTGVAMYEFTGGAYVVVEEMEIDLLLAKDE